MKHVVALPLFVCFICVGHLSQAQGKTELYKTILHMDSVLFDAFNNHQLPVLQQVFAENVEFYHSKDLENKLAELVN